MRLLRIVKRGPLPGFIHRSTIDAEWAEELLRNSELPCSRWEVENKFSGPFAMATQKI